jgi:pSer/pThr/pTyr-binding forkhead associated (FHA) protein
MYRPFRDVLTPELIGHCDEGGRREVQKRDGLKCRVMWILQSPETTFRLRPGAVKTVGRAARADFIVDAALVSRLHCRLTAGDDNLEVVDLSSTNGTFVNDKRVKKAHLSNGDRLRVGRVELKVDRQA